MDTLPDMDESVALLVACPPRLRCGLFLFLYVCLRSGNLLLKLCDVLECLGLRLQLYKLFVELGCLHVKFGLVRYVRCIHNFMCVKKSNAVKPPNEKS